jgi:hypothetical protein
MKEIIPQWRAQCLSHEGIIVGTDLTQEWLLPWWWSHYHSFNSYPVAFVNFGMSEEAKHWCCQHGELISLPHVELLVAEREEIEPHLVQQMEEACGNNFWSSRNAWFKKPLACLHSPFAKSIWIDLDCQVRGSLSPLFASEEPFALAEEESDLPPCYNAGVIVFKHGINWIEEWAKRCLLQHQQFRGDQDVLNAIIKEHELMILTLPALYNWSRLKGKHPEAVIWHWHGPQGKNEIAYQITRANLKSLGIV